LSVDSLRVQRCVHETIAAHAARIEGADVGVDAEIRIARARHRAVVLELRKATRASIPLAAAVDMHADVAFRYGAVAMGSGKGFRAPEGIILEFPLNSCPNSR
jgi:hypothetical protein